MVDYSPLNYDPIARIQRGQDFVSGLYDTQARLGAGRQAAAGDLSGAAGTLTGRGLFEEAAPLQTRATGQRVLGGINNHDFAGAKAAAAEAGDPHLYAGALGAEDNDKKQRVEWMSHATDALLQVPEAERQAAFDQYIKPTLGQMGAGDDVLSQIEGSHFTDQSLKSFKAMLGGVGEEGWSIVNAGDGLVMRVNSRTGEKQVLSDGSAKHEWRERKLTNGATEWIDLLHPDAEPETTDPTGAAAAPSAAPTGGVYDHIALTAGNAGAKPEEVSYLTRLAQRESGGKANAQNGKSTGVFQFHPDTFASVGGGDIRNIDDQTKAALNLSRRDRAALQQAGLPADDATVYLMHQQGAGGARALLTAPPEVNAIAALAPAYGSEATARKAVLGNGGTADMTAGEFVQSVKNYYLTGKQGVTTAAADAPARKGRAIPGDEAPAEGGGLDPATLDRLADDFNAHGGKLPGYSRKPEILEAIAKRATEKLVEEHRTAAEARGGGAQFDADAGALKKLTASVSAMAGSEDRARLNGQTALDLVDKVGNGNIKIFNKWINAGRSATGDPDVDAFAGATKTYADEYTKVVTMSATGGGSQTSDSAREHAYSLINTAQSPAQFKAVMAILDKDMVNSQVAFDKQRQVLIDRLSATTPTAPAAAPAGAIDPNGNYKGFTGAQVLTAKSLPRTGPLGKSKDNPYVPKTEAEYEKLPSGSYYIFHDGRVLGPKP